MEYCVLKGVANSNLPFVTLISSFLTHKEMVKLICFPISFDHFLYYISSHQYVFYVHLAHYGLLKNSHEHTHTHTHTAKHESCTKRKITKCLFRITFSIFFFMIILFSRSNFHYDCISVIRGTFVIIMDNS